MAKIKFKYNKETLTYDSIESNLKTYISSGLRYILIPAFLAVLFLFSFVLFFDTPKEKQLTLEKNRMAEDLQHINNCLKSFNENLNVIANQDNQQFRVICQLDSIPKNVRNSGFGGTNKYSYLAGYDYSELVMEVSMEIDKLNKKLDIQEMSFIELSKELDNQAWRINHTPAITPINNKDLTRFGSDYGIRINPFTGRFHFHKGVDLTAPRGKPIYASGDGTVIFADYSTNGYGKHVIIDHGVDGLSTLYGHMSKITVKKGDKVKRGQEIGKIGSTGMSTGPHLHYEVRINGKHVNPINYQIKLTSEQYEELLSNANADTETDSIL